MHRRLAVIIIAVGFLGSPLGAQSIAGFVRNRRTEAPYPRVLVSLRAADSSGEASARAVDSARTDSIGTFQFIGIAPGRYRLEFSMHGIDMGAAGPYFVTADSDVQRAFVLEPVREVYTAKEVDRRAAPLPNNAMPRYPDELRDAGLVGGVVMQFIVDTIGQVDSADVRVLCADHALFAETVRQTILRMRFLPAELHGRKVEQVVQEPFEFSLTSDYAKHGTRLATPTPTDPFRACPRAAPKH